MAEEVRPAVGSEIGGGAGEGFEGVEEQSGGLLVVGDAELGLDAAVVGQADVDGAVRAQPVGGLVAGDAQAPEVDDDLEGVEVVGGLGVEQLVVQDVHPG